MVIREGVAMSECGYPLRAKELQVWGFIVIAIGYLLLAAAASDRPFVF
jgi:hypothetical protein